MAYRCKDGITEDFSTNLEFLDHAKPVYKEFEGGFGGLAGGRGFDELPKAAKEYISFIESYIGIPVRFIGVGAGREAMLVKG